MAKTKNQIIWTFVGTVIFYGIGRLGYEMFYRWTIDFIKYFSDGKVSFYGKFPFLFFGDPRFGLIFASIPLTSFLCYRILQAKYHAAFLWTISFYLPLFISIYLLNCHGQSFGLVTSNDFYKPGQVLSYNLRQVNLNAVFLGTISSTTILTALINFAKRFWVMKHGGGAYNI